MRVRMVITALMLITCGSAAGAEEDGALTWNDCVREAIGNHPDLVSTRAETEQAEAAEDSARAALLPQVDAGASARKSGAEGSNSESYSYDVSAGQLIYDGGKTANSVREAKEGERSARLKEKVVSSEVRLRLRNAFVDLLNAKELVKITGQIARRRARNLKLVELRYEAGKEHKGSLLTAEAQAAEAEKEKRQAARKHDLTQVTLAKELGRAEPTGLVVKGQLKARDEEAEKPDFRKLAEENPIIARIASARAVAEYRLRSAKADYAPTVRLSAGAGRSSDEWPPDSDSWNVGLSLSLPLFEGGSRSAELRRRRAGVTAAEAAEKGTMLSVVETLAETWAAYRDAIDSTSVRKKFLEAARERARIAEAQYSSGLISFNNWIIIEDNLVNVEKAWLQTQAAAMKAHARWVYAKGGTLEDENKD
ncbi:MAG: TolC family protein [Kiritimatiellia bacterium]